MPAPVLRLVPSRPSRRDDQSRETKRRLLGAAVALVTEVGWRRTTVEQICERAGVAKGTFFVHFRTKEAIVVTLVQLQIGAASAARDALLATGASPLERLKETTLTLGDQAASSVELSRAVLIASLESQDVGGATDAVFQQLYGRMIEDAHEAIEGGFIRKGGPDAETAAGLFMACYLGAALHCTSSPRAKPLREVLRPLVDATLAALTASPSKSAKTARSARSAKVKSAARDAGARKTAKKTSVKRREGGAG